MKNQRLGVFSGMGMVIANMIGAGVFLSTGFMAQDMNAQQILLAWFVGMLIAMTGAKAYSGLVQLVPQSGGEYRFLSTLIHPALGYFAGWASLLIGFSAPIAISAMAVGAFAGTLHAGVNTTLIAVLVILALTTAHAVGMRISITAQNSLVAVKIILVMGFVIAGLIYGNNAWPEWTPPNASERFPVGSFMRNLFYIAFAFSGWNAAIYAASEFKNPKRDVPRAMILGSLVVGILYLCINWIFVANLTPEQSMIVSTYETNRITLGHLIMRNIMGDTGAACMSIFAIIAFISSASAMTFLGPRVYAAMAQDGFLPTALKEKEGKPPVGAVVLQGAIALFLVLAYQLQDALKNVGAILTLFSALTVFSLFWVYFKRKEFPRSAPSVLIAGGLFFMISAVMLYYGFSESPTLNLWVGVCALAALIGYFIAIRKMPEKDARMIPLFRFAVSVGIFTFAGPPVGTTVVLLLGVRNFAEFFDIMSYAYSVGAMPAGVAGILFGAIIAKYNLGTVLSIITGLMAGAIATALIFSLIVFSEGWVVVFGTIFGAISGAICGLFTGRLFRNVSCSTPRPFPAGGGLPGEGDPYPDA